MIMRSLCFAAALCSSVSLASAQEQVTAASGAVLRGLDKINGQTVDLEIATGRTADFGTLKITLGDCRYPVGNPAGNAYAAMEVTETGHEGTVFSGWMIASSPALSAMDHPRYDIWVLRCITS